MVVPDNKFAFSNCEKYIVLWAGMGWQKFIKLTFSSLLTQQKVAKE